MKYTNPVISGFNPDPSICKAGEDYYLVTSTFEYFPGIPIYHSIDLVNWEHIGNAVTRKSQLPFEKTKPSGGIWAPTIRYGNEKFYITATFSEGGNFIISAEDPCGEWSDAVWTEMDGIDPSMLFDDGKMYYCANDCGSRGKLHETEGISVAEMDPDSGKIIGEIKRVWNGTGGGWIEAPHIYHISDWYYIIAAEGGTGVRHTEVEARSRSIWGPYESCPHNPILTNRNDTDKQAACCGHADLIQEADGKWWMVHLATRPYTSGKSPLGRETFLIPVAWQDGWFFAKGKKARIENDAPTKVIQSRTKVREFDFAEKEWELEWLFIRGIDERNIVRGEGKLILCPSGVKLSDTYGTPSFAAVRQYDFNCAAEAEMEYKPQNNGDEAGMAIYLTPQNIYRICKKREDGKNYIIVLKQADDFKQEIYRAEVSEGRLQFRIEADKQKYSFSYSVNGVDFISAGEASAKFLTTEVADRCFTGTVIGVYAEADSETTAEAVIYNFKIALNQEI